MPNHVTNKLIVDCTNEQAQQISEEILDNGCIDFNKLIPIPMFVYEQDIGYEDQQDFGEFCGLDYKRKYWGAKWNAYQGSAEYRYDALILLFNTAWSPPYPIIISFANRYELNFRHKYYDEAENFWGIDVWENKKRIQTIKNREEDRENLRIELTEN